jgi:cytochrome oxidase Cu insertion factor (SCO1/SenC/PrrC family)
VGAPTTFVAVTLDPERDSEAALAMAASHWELGERWHLLGGDVETVRAVIRDYGVKWARRPDGEIAHENVILLIDARGRLAYTYRGLGHAEESLAADLARLAAERG